MPEAWSSGGAATIQPTSPARMLVAAWAAADSAAMRYVWEQTTGPWPAAWSTRGTWLLLPVPGHASTKTT